MWKSIARQDLLRAWYRVLESVVNVYIESNWKYFGFFANYDFIDHQSNNQLIWNCPEQPYLTHKNVVTHITF